MTLRGRDESDNARHARDRERSLRRRREADRGRQRLLADAREIAIDFEHAPEQVDRYWRELNESGAVSNADLTKIAGHFGEIAAPLRPISPGAGAGGSPAAVQCARSSAARDRLRRILDEIRSGPSPDESPSEEAAGDRSGEPLPENVRRSMEHAFGEDFSDVRTVVSEHAVRLGADAYAQGNRVVFAPGTYEPQTRRGRELLGHELAHVVQQREGRTVTPVGDARRAPILDDPALEREASEAGARVARGEPAGARSAGAILGAGGRSQVPLAAPLQRALSAKQAKAEIEDACEGWGTDEEKIYRAIRECSDRATLKKDPRVQYLLRDDLSGHELLKAGLLLEYGKESSFPKPIKEMWAATDCWGTDEKRLIDGFRPLSKTDAQALWAIPGVREVIEDELSGEWLQATRGILTGAAHQEALDRHKKNVSALQDVLKQMHAAGGGSGAKGAAAPNRQTQTIKNTAEWLDPKGGGTAKNDLFVLTRTHDYTSRAKHHNQKDKYAYFGDTPKYPGTGATYDQEITSTVNIHFSETNVRGEHNGRKIWVHEPAERSAETVRNVLVHEVQHDADKHDDEAGWQQAYKSPEESWVRYKTEFRAYWVDSERDSLSAKPGSASGAWNNEKQKAIFDHLYRGYAEWLKPNYDNNATVGGKKFQDLVHGYTKPEGLNLVNSPRIQEFIQFIDTLAKDPKNPAAFEATAVQEAKKLTAEDRSYVNSAEAAPLQDKLKANLGAQALDAVAKELGGGKKPSWA